MGETRRRYYLRMFDHWAHRTIIDGETETWVDFANRHELDPLQVLEQLDETWDDAWGEED